MSENDIEIEINGRESKLVLKYGYPFPEQAALFEEVSGKKGWHTIVIGKYWLELIIGDLSRSIREVKSQSLQEEMDALCNTLELSLKGKLMRAVE